MRRMMALRINRAEIYHRAGDAGRVCPGAHLNYGAQPVLAFKGRRRATSNGMMPAPTIAQS